jgi:hypothetical protein
MTRFAILEIFFVCLSSLVLANSSSIPKVSFQSGECYLQLKRIKTPKPILLETNQSISDPAPYALVTTSNSFLELQLGIPKANQIIRLGQSTAVEFRDNQSYFFFQGSALFSTQEPKEWIIQSEITNFQFSAKGTWLVETTPMGFKLILLEGDLLPNSKKGTPIEPISPGDLVLITGENGQISQSIKVELPILLSTSRLINLFPNPLFSQARLISAAQVQSLRTKARYNAFIGGVSEDSKLRIWTPNSNKPIDD